MRKEEQAGWFSLFTASDLCEVLVEQREVASARSLRMFPSRCLQLRSNSSTLKPEMLLTLSGMSRHTFSFSSVYAFSGFGRERPAETGSLS